MQPFEPDGIYNGVPYRVLEDNSIEVMFPHGLVKFQNIDRLIESCAGAVTGVDVSSPITSSDATKFSVRTKDVPFAGRSLEYYLFLNEKINSAKQNPARLRSLVYEQFRLNIKSDALFGRTSTDLTDLVQKIQDFELAVARVESEAKNELHLLYDRRDKTIDAADPKPNSIVQILPPKQIVPLYAGKNEIQWADNFPFARLNDEFARLTRFTNQYIRIALVGMALVATLVVALLLVPAVKNFRSIQVVTDSSPANNSMAKPPDPSEKKTAETARELAARTDDLPNVPFPLPTTFGIYVLSENKLAELGALPINIPDPRVELSAEIKIPSSVTVSDSKPAFILFRRDFLNNAPQKITLRVIARTTRETKIVGENVKTNDVESTWRIRNISRDLKVSPIAGQREMIIARLDDDSSLAAGRYALVINRIGYDFTIKGPVKSPAFCLEEFATTNGSVFTQCRTP